MGLLGYGVIKILRGIIYINELEKKYSNIICMIDIVYILIYWMNIQVLYVIMYNIYVLIENIGDLVIIELFGFVVFMRLIMFNIINILICF